MIWSALVFAATIDLTPQDDPWGKLQAAKAGDEFVLHAGTYKVPGYVNLVLAGTEALPIVIRGGAGEAVIIEGIPEQNAINVEGSWYTLRDLEISGGSHGVRVGTSAHAVFEDLHIHHVGDVGVSCNRPDNSYEAITIRKVHIHDTGMGGGPGECMYLGCNEGACKVWDSLVEFNWCHDTLAGEQGDGIEFKTGSYGTTVRHNVIHDVKYPGITMYGTQGMPGNIVEGNVVWNVIDNGIQTVGDVIVRNNIVANTGASGIAAKASQGELVKDLTIIHNTVTGAGDACMRGNDFPAGVNIVIANNAFYCEGGTAIKLAQGAGTAVLAANAVIGGIEGVDTGTLDGGPLATAFSDPAALQFYLPLGSPLIDTAEPKYYAIDDFNCLLRHQGPPDIGVYEASTPENPGWLVAPGFKECAVEGGSDSAGETGSESGATSGGTGDEAGATNASTGDATGGPEGSEGSDDGDAPTGDPGGSDSGATGGSTGTSGNADGGGQDEAGGCGCTEAPARAPGLLIGLLALLRRRRR